MNTLPEIKLRAVTPPEWAKVALRDFNAFLVDHALCERKASAVGMSFVVRYPDRTLLMEPMIQFAREELEHFHQVYRLVEERGLQLSDDTKDAYVGTLMNEVRTGRQERFLDRLIVAGVIEARGHERLGLITEAMEEPSLRAFYQRVTRAEGRHKDFFLEMAALYFPNTVVETRLNEILDVEARAIEAVPWRSALH